MSDRGDSQQRIRFGGFSRERANKLLKFVGSETQADVSLTSVPKKLFLRFTDRSCCTQIMRGRYEAIGAVRYMPAVMLSYSFPSAANDVQDVIYGL